MADDRSSRYRPGPRLPRRFKLTFINNCQVKANVEDHVDNEVIEMYFSSSLPIPLNTLVPKDNLCYYPAALCLYIIHPSIP